MMLKLVDAVNEMITWTYMNKGQGHSLTLLQGHSD